MNVLYTAFIYVSKHDSYLTVSFSCTLTLYFILIKCNLVIFMTNILASYSKQYRSCIVHACDVSGICKAVRRTTSPAES